MLNSAIREGGPMHSDLCEMVVTAVDAWFLIMVSAGLTSPFSPIYITHCLTHGGAKVNIGPLVSLVSVRDLAIFSLLGMLKQDSHWMLCTSLLLNDI